MALVAWSCTGDGPTGVPALAVITTALPDGVVDLQYEAELTAAGGLAPLSWVVTQGSLLAGVMLAVDGKLSGAPTGPGSSTFTVQVTSSDGQTAEQSLTIDVHGALTVTTSSLPAGVEDVPYAETLAATGGEAPHTWTVAAGSLPTGLSMAGDGSISGTPATSGQSSFTVEVTSADGQTAQQEMSEMAFELPSSSLTRLSDLHIRANAISDISPLAALTSLTHLNLAFNQLTDVSALSGLTSMERLVLFGNQITDIGALESMTGLRQVDLRDNPDLSNLQPLVANAGMGPGDSVNVRDTSVSCSDIVDLQAKGVSVTHNCTP